MENVMEENSPMYRKERDSFIDGLRRFHSGRGTHIRQLPTLGGREVDLLHLYRQVTVRGGWGKINEERKWHEIAEGCHLPAACVNSSQALRYIYMRYLELYEKVHFFGEDPDQRRNDGQEELPGQRKKRNYASTVPMSYNNFQHKLSDYMRQTLSLPMPEQPDIYNKIEQSLTSGLPNEVDFAMNICTLLSSEGKHTLTLDKSPQIVNLMLGHIGVFDTGPGSLREVHLEAWKPASGHNYLRFWWESIEDKDVRKLICPEVRADNSAVKGIDAHDPCLSAVLNIKRDCGMYDKEGQRVVQVSMVLRNLSFEVENMKVLAASDVFLRYIILAAHCNYHSVRQLALDTLGNVGIQMVLSPLDPYLKCVIFTILRRCLLSDDKFELVTGLELLARLCQVPTNDDVLCDALDHAIYARIVSFLTVHDIQLIAYTLECLYQLSELGEVAATHIAQVLRAVATLVSLVTVEAQSYGPESIKGIRVVEHIPTGMAPPVPTPQPCEAMPRPIAPRTGTPQKPTIPQALRRPPATPTPPTQVRPPAVPTPPPTTVAIQDGGRSLACRWLQSFYEFDPNSQVNKMDVYANYLNAVSKLGVAQVPDMRELIMALRITFPRVDIMKLEKDNGSSPVILVKGIKQRQMPLQFEPNVSIAAWRFPPTRVATTGQNLPPILPRPSTPQTSTTILPRPSTSQNAVPPAQQFPPQRLSFAPQPLVQPSTTFPTTIQVTAQHTPPLSPSNAQSMLQQALLKSCESSSAPSEHILPTPPSPSLTPPPNQIQLKSGDQNLIKTLLANKLQQNIQRFHDDKSQLNVFCGTQGTEGQNSVQNGVPTPGTVGNNLNCEMGPPRVPNAQTKSSSAFESEFQQFMQTQNAEVVYPEVVTKRTRRKSMNSSPKSKVKKTKSCEDQTESAVNNKSQTDLGSVGSSYVGLQNSDTVMDTSQSQTQHETVFSSNSSVNSNSQPICDQRQPVNTPSMDVNTCEVQCDVNIISHNSVHSDKSNSQTPVTISECANSSSNKEPVFNGILTPSQSPKEISPCKLNTSIEEKKARIAQLMKDTKILKEQLKGINGVSVADDGKSTDTLVAECLAANTFESNVNESQGTKTNCGGTSSDNLIGDHCKVNGFPETVNGNHTLDITVASLKSEQSSESDLKCDTNEPVLSNREVVDTPGLTLDDLNRNNNCNGEGDSSPPSPMSMSSSQADAEQPSSSIEPPSSVQSDASQSYESSGISSNTQTEQSQNSPISNSSGFVQPPMPSNSAFVQPSHLPGPISTPKVIMSAVPQNLSFAQSAPQNVVHGQTPQANQTVTQPLLHEIVTQANQVVAQPQMVAHGGQIVQQQTQMVAQGGQIISQQIPVPVQNIGQSQIVASQGCTAPQPQLTAQVTVPQQLQQMVHGQMVQHAGQGLVQQAQMLTPQAQVLSQQDIISQAAAQTQVLQGVTQAQVMNPQGQIVQQSLPGHVVQQLLQQAHMAQQQATLSQNQIIVQQTPQATQQGTVLVQHTQNQVLSQMLHVVQTQAQNVPQLTVSLGQPGQVTANQLSLNVGQVVQQQMVQRPMLVQPVQTQLAGTSGVTTQVVHPNATHQVNPVRFIAQPMVGVQMPIQVSTATNQSVAGINQSQSSPALQKISAHATLMQQQLHSANPSITTPPPASPQSSRSSPGPMPSPGGSKPTKRPPSRQSDSGDKPKKKRRSKSKDTKASSVSSSPSPVTTPVQSPMVVTYVCEWSGCNKCFEQSKPLQKHVIQGHYPSVCGENGYCPWQGCDSLKRQRWSLITHIQDKHLNEASLRAAALRRHQQAMSPGPSASTTPAAPPPVYPNDAAVQAIKRFAVKPPYQEFIEMKEGPVTKHIRLTSALILRNLARYSEVGRKELKKHESLLAYVALSPVESSAAISTCLMELHKA